MTLEIPDFDPREVREKIEKMESEGDEPRIPETAPEELRAMEQHMIAIRPRLLEEYREKEKQWEHFKANATPEQLEEHKKVVEALEAQKKDEELAWKLRQINSDNYRDNEGIVVQKVHHEDWDTYVDEVREVLDAAAEPEKVILKALMMALTTEYLHGLGMHPGEGEGEAEEEEAAEQD
ncbi:hypothetical protein [Nesterenkonia aerolata]|uniref:Uncharacterized protein n=1 Tax=Nesterenkonia aerolata TaxID=3074079 RepID=A0ABU2DSW7_9MICC|nr:hypothetical protein [Nesterenkonia sp. LY-0111]MDR8019595.1 hypothetical protein [Nesterenkonia sp. LY-0111]